MVVGNLKKFPHSVLEISCSQETDGQPENIMPLAMAIASAETKNSRIKQ